MPKESNKTPRRQVSLMAWSESFKLQTNLNGPYERRQSIYLEQLTRKLLETGCFFRQKSVKTCDGSTHPIDSNVHLANIAELAPPLTSRNTIYYRRTANIVRRFIRSI